MKRDQAVAFQAGVPSPAWFDWKMQVINVFGSNESEVLRELGLHQNPAETGQQPQMANSYPARTFGVGF